MPAAAIENGAASRAGGAGAATVRVPPAWSSDAPPDDEALAVPEDPPESIVAAMPYVVRSARVAGEFRLWVRARDEERRHFEREHGVHVEVRHLALEDLFPLMLDSRKAGELEVA